MSKFGKLFAWTAVVGAAVAGGAAYLKKKEKSGNADKVSEDSDNEKILNVDTDFTDENRKYVSITINSKKAKEAMCDAKDTLEDLASKAKDKVTDIVGEERFETAKETVADFADDAKDWAKDSAKKAKNYAMDAKDKIKDGISRYTEDSYEFDENTEDETDDAQDSSETCAAQENASDENDFLTEEIDDDING